MSPLRALPAAGVVALALFLLAPGGMALVQQPLPIVGSPLSPSECADLCPDMLVEAAALNPVVTTINYGPTSCAVQEGMTPPGPQRIVRFTTSLPNDGPGDLVVGRPSTNPENFYYSPCHGHYHTKDYADYRVWRPADYAAYEQLRLVNPFVPASQLIASLPDDQKPIAGLKAGFCVLDLKQSPSPLGRVLASLNGPKYGCGNMGISSGWADVYSSGILGQWVVITNVPAGDYLLNVEVNADHHYQELNYWNNSVTRAFTIS